MTDTIIFSGKVNAIYEGISFENGVFTTSDTKKIARLRASVFYRTGEIREVTCDVEPEPPELGTAPPVIEPDIEEEPEPEPKKGKVKK